MLNKIEGHTSLIRGTAVNAAQMALVADLIKWNNGEAKMNRKTLKAGHQELRGKKASPYFIAKNVACKVKGEHGMYNLAVLKLSAEAAKAPKVEKADTKPAKITKPAASKGKSEPRPGTKKGAGTKKEGTVAKKGGTSKKVKEAPISTEPVADAITVPVAEAA